MSARAQPEVADVAADDQETPRDRLLLAFEMFEFGVEMMAANLRRRHPGASPEQIEQMLEEWLAQPDAEPADSDCVPVYLPMFR